MIIRVGNALDPAAVDLLEADRFDRLHVQAQVGCSRTRIDDALRRACAGRFDDDQAEPLIAVDWIRRHGSAGEGWRTSFDAMLTYAEAKGWYSAAEGTVRAHLEYTAATGLNPDEFRAAFRGHPAGVAVITADDGSGPAGLTATSVFSVSAEPPLLIFSVSHTSSSCPTITAAESVVVHLLGARDLWIAELCATSGIDRFADVSVWARLGTGEPYFPAASRWIRAEVVARTEAGTSTVMTVVALESGSGTDEEHLAEPLVYHNRTWHALGQHSELGVRTR